VIYPLSQFIGKWESVCPCELGTCELGKLESV